MELGTWSDWFEAGAEILAVVVALFLPVYQGYKQRRATRRRVGQNIQRLTTTLLTVPKTSPEWQTDYHSLQTLVRLYAALLTDTRGEPIVLTGEQIITALDQPEIDQAVVHAQLVQLADQTA